MIFSPIRWFGLVLLCCVFPTSASADGEKATVGQRVQVMVIGVTHFADTGQHMVNTEAADVLAPARQRELEKLVEALAAFKPTAVAIEKIASAPDFHVEEYSGFARKDLLSKRNENFQIGYRLAKRAGLDVVFGIDEQPSAKEPDYFPFDKVQDHVARTGQMDAFGQYFGRLQARIEAAVAENTKLSIPSMLLSINQPRSLLSSTDYFFELMKYDRGEDQPGAELYAYYMMRNAKIFGKLMAVSKPGDRIIVIYGAGHKRWLDQLLKSAPTFEVVSPVPYLEKAVSE